MRALQILFGTVSGLLLAASIAAAPISRHAPNEVLVGFRNNVTPNQRAQLRAQMHGSIIRKFDWINVEHIRLHGQPVESIVRRFKNHPLVEYVEPNYEIYPAALPNDSLFSQQWSLENTGQAGGTPLADIRAVPTWDVFSGEQTLKIAVLDDGIDPTHPDLAANMWSNPGEAGGIPCFDDDGNGFIDDIFGYNFRDDNQNGQRDGEDCIPPTDPVYSHGTHVAGIIAGRGNNGQGISGVTQRAQLVSLKVMGRPLAMSVPRLVASATPPVLVAGWQMLRGTRRTVTY